jgi:hypothetical protein
LYELPSHPLQQTWQEDLPEKIMKAAIVLGYTENIWDYDKPAPSWDDKYWEELTEDENTAAKLFGYNEKMWDEE